MKKNLLLLYFMFYSSFFSFSQVALCPGTCTDFIDFFSTNTTSWQWTFAGATPSTSTDENPTNICYSTPGNYDVTLIATGTAGSDTFLLSNYVTVYPYPPAIDIEYCGDTLFATLGFVSYQWYFSGNIINGATDYFYIAQVNGDYNVVATDVNGCQVEAAYFGMGWGGNCNCCTGIDESALGNTISISPNPTNEFVVISSLLEEGQPQFVVTTVKISIYNRLGEAVMALPLRTTNSELPSIDVRALPAGMYYLQVRDHEKEFWGKFIKE